MEPSKEASPAAAGGSSTAFRRPARAGGVSLLYAACMTACAAGLVAMATSTEQGRQAFAAMGGWPGCAPFAVPGLGSLVAGAALEGWALKRPARPRKVVGDLRAFASLVLYGLAFWAFDMVSWSLWADRPAVAGVWFAAWAVQCWSMSRAPMGICAAALLEAREIERSRRSR